MSTQRTYLNGTVIAAVALVVLNLFEPVVVVDICKQYEPWSWDWIILGCWLL